MQRIRLRTRIQFVAVDFRLPAATTRTSTFAARQARLSLSRVQLQQLSPRQRNCKWPSGRRSRRRAWRPITALTDLKWPLTMQFISPFGAQIKKNCDAK